MNLKDVFASENALQFLDETVAKNRVSHAQLFVGKAGYGTFSAALAYAQTVLCNNNETCNQRVQNLQHPDLHFSIPTFKVEKTEALTRNYFTEFKSLITENPQASLNNWYETLDAGNKQGFLSKNEVVEVVQKLSLKSFEGGYKVLIIWNADKMKTEFANKFLKLLEEPAEKTLFILITESSENMLDTILSRCQLLQFSPLKEEKIVKFLTEKYSLDDALAQKIAQKSNGDLNTAKNIALQQTHNYDFEKEFVEWTRNSFRVKKKLSSLQNIIKQAERLATWNKELQKQYLKYCLETFRQALLQNYNNPELVDYDLDLDGFNFQGFSKFISGKNIQLIIEEINQSHYYLERNANAKLTFINLGIKLTRFIHQS